ncbi:membrane hypothetical protein [Planktothrix serta PCC 8927]|uniref:EamA domain-containing protein n=1 Tax=Planktothrix serta PCC 8927 TaxID=671068 RepID=A0A7Z9BWM3_9CYAN|nr:EamA family transporter [Planktothrix serta]VXD24002.1 membrane hypothetical protein [Planktothrix serta PCC 8927]
MATNLQKSPPIVANISINFGLISAIASPTLWAFYTILIKQVSFSPCYLTICVRILAVLTLLLIIFALRGKFAELINLGRKPEICRSLIASGGAYLLHLAVFYPAILLNYQKVASAGMFFCTIATAFLSYFILKEPLNRQKKQALGLGMIAIALFASQVITDPLSLFFLVSIGLTFALVIIARKSAAKQINNSITLVTLETLLLPAPLAVFSLNIMPAFSSTVFELNLGQWLLLLLVSLVSLIPILLQAEAVNPRWNVPTTTIGIFNLLSPTGQFLIATLMFQQTATFGQWFAIFLLIFALIRYNLSPNQK